MKATSSMTSDGTIAEVYWQCLLVMVVARTTICSTRGLHLWRSFHKASRITEGRRHWDSWVRCMVVVVVMLKVVAVLLKATCVWMSQCMVVL